MDTEQLLAFQQIVREGSFTRAAVSLAVGQPAISARIRALEDAVGGALFTRGRRVTLTPLGESFLPYARRATEVLTEGIEVSRLARTGQRGRVTIASLGSLAGSLVGPAMASTLAKHPELQWLVRSGAHEVVLGFLIDGLVELGVIAWPAPETAAAELTRLFTMEEPVVLAVAKKHPLATRRNVTTEDVARLSRPFLRLRWWRVHHREILRLSERAASSVDVPMETARYLTLQGVAAGFFPRPFIAEDVENGHLKIVAVGDLPPLTRKSALVRKARTTAPAASTLTFVDALRAQARELGILRRGG